MTAAPASYLRLRLRTKNDGAGELRQVKRKWRLLLLWLIASAIWIAFALVRLDTAADVDVQIEGPQAESVWSIEDAFDRAALLFGVPLALLGTGLAIGWILKGTRR
jgi:hypothetical protein